MECKDCGSMILDTTFSKNNGLCMPCFKLVNTYQSTSIYAGFWRRFGAYWIDFIIMLPLVYLVIWGGSHYRLFHLYYFIPGVLFGIWFSCYLVKRYGGTPGKLLLKIKISKLDGSPVGYREALLRYSVMFILGILSSIAAILAVLNMTDDFYFSMEWMERTQYIQKNMPSWYFFINVSIQVWIWSEFIVMLTNKKRRALHDFLAGTVVINNRK